MSPDYGPDAYAYAAGLEALTTPLTPDAFPHLADVRTDTRTCTTCGAPTRDHLDEGRDQCRSCWWRA